MLSVESFRAVCTVALVAGGGAVSAAASRTPVVGVLDFTNKADDGGTVADVHETK